MHKKNTFINFLDLEVFINSIIKIICPKLLLRGNL